jgi:hypothetical protein
VFLPRTILRQIESRLTTNVVAKIVAFAWRHAHSGGDRSLIELA